MSPSSLVIDFSLVDKKGQVIDRFQPGLNPSSEKVTGEIEKALAEK